MFCQKCGAPLPADAKFCAACGQTLINTPLVTPASMGTRFLNFLLDWVASLVIFGAFGVLSSMTQGTASNATIAVGMVAFYGYYLITELIWGKTFGKMLTKTKVVTKEGLKPGFGKILGRSLARIIPFEPFSFLFGKFPIGWHDSLSGTMVVSNKMTPEEVKAIDPVKLKGSSRSGSVLAIVVIAIIGTIVIVGILSSIVLASLSTARAKGQDAANNARLSNFRAVAELYAANNNDSYKGLCASKEAAQTLAPSSTTVTPVKYSCYDSEKQFALSFEMNDKTFSCTDANGKIVTAKSSITGPSCFSATTGTSTVGWAPYTSEVDGFTILMPETPLFESDDKLPVPGTDVTYDWHHYTASDVNDTSFFVFKYIYSQKLGIIESEKPDLLKSFLDAISETDPGMKVTSSVATKVDGNHVLDFSIKNGLTLSKGRLVLIGETPYLLGTDYEQQNYDQQIYDNFINSFKTK